MYLKLRNGKIKTPLGIVDIHLFTFSKSINIAFKVSGSTVFSTMSCNVKINTTL